MSVTTEGFLQRQTHGCPNYVTLGHTQTSLMDLHAIKANTFLWQSERIPELIQLHKIYLCNLRINR